MRLVLHHHGPSRDLVAVADIPDLEADQVAAAQLAVDTQIEQGELAYPTRHLEPDAKDPDVLELERCLLPDDLALVPWLAMSSSIVGFHDGPPSVWRHHAAASAPAPAMAPDVHH
jgi:hypothetical protein